MEMDLTKDEIERKIDRRFILFEHISQEQAEQTDEKNIHEWDTTTAFVALTP